VVLTQRPGMIIAVNETAFPSAESYAKLCVCVSVHVTSSGLPLPEVRNTTADCCRGQLDALATSFSGLSACCSYRPTSNWQQSLLLGVLPKELRPELQGQWWLLA